MTQYLTCDFAIVFYGISWFVFRLLTYRPTKNATCICDCSACQAYEVEVDEDDNATQLHRV